MRKIFFVLFLLFPGINAFPQTEGKPLIDSLENILQQKSLPGEEKVNALTTLSYEYRNYNPEKGIALGIQAEELAKKIRLDEKLGEIYFTLSVNYNVYNDPIKCYEYALLSVQFNEKYHNHSILPVSYVNIVVSDPTLTKDNVKALLQKAIDALPECKDTLWLTRAYGNIGNQYKQFHFDKPAEEMIRKAISLAIRINNNFLIAHNYSRLGSLFLNQGNLDSALFYFDKGLVYFHFLNEKRVTSESYGEFKCRIFIDIYHVTGEKRFLDSAYHSAMIGYGLATELKYMTEVATISKNISEVLKLKGQDKEALVYLENYTSLSDSLNNNEMRNKFFGILMNERDQLAEQQLKTKEAEVGRQKALVIASFIILGLLFAVLFILYNGYRKQKAANQLLKETQQQLIQQEKMASLGSLAAGIAHEIKNPLNFVTNFSIVSTELMEEMINSKSDEERNELGKSIQQNLEKIAYHGKRADGIIRSMLDHSRAVSDEKQLTDLNRLAEEYADLAYQTFKSNHLGFTCRMIKNFDPKLPKIKVVPSDLGRVFLNLCMNAFDAVNEIQNAKVELVTHNMDKNIEIRFRDNGTGIPLSLQKKIFDPFFTTKAAGQGTGLGLSISYEIVKVHGGDIKVQSRANGGTEFIVSLPLS